MKSLSIGRQFTAIVAAFAIAMPAAVIGLSFVFSRNAATTRRVLAAGNRQTADLFALISSVGQVQGMAQRLIREKDPDTCG